MQKGYELRAFILNTRHKINQSTESADFDKRDGWIVNRAGYFDIKQTWSACFFFSDTNWK